MFACCVLFVLYLHVATAKVCVCWGRGGKEVLQRKLSEVVCYTCISPAVAVVVGIFTTIGHVILKIE